MSNPSGYSDELALRICERIVEGESLRAICREEGMPSQSMVFRWLEANQAFREQYARARDLQADTFADELTEIADNATNDWMERNGQEDKGWQANGENIQRSRVRIDTRKWIASKLKPKKYGDSQSIEHSGEIGLRRLIINE